MDDYQRRSALRVCESLHRGVRTASEACEAIIFWCVEPDHAAEYLDLMPDEVRATLGGLLRSLPTSDEEWVVFRGIAQLDGDEWSWARAVAGCRANTEATRACHFREASPPTAVDFHDRVRAGYRAWLAELQARRGVVRKLSCSGVRYE